MCQDQLQVVVIISSMCILTQAILIHFTELRRLNLSMPKSMIGKNISNCFWTLLNRYYLSSDSVGHYLGLRRNSSIGGMKHTNGVKAILNQQKQSYKLREYRC